MKVTILTTFDVQVRKRGLNVTGQLSGLVLLTRGDILLALGPLEEEHTQMRNEGTQGVRCKF